MDAYPAEPHLPEPPQECPYGSLIEALLSYHQADEDGVMCIVSRQAVHEAADILTALSEAGWVVAPMYTNSAQRDAGVDAVGLGVGMSWANRTPQRVASDIYRAMISAATPPAKGGE